MYVFWLPLWCLVAIMLSVLRCTSSDYPFGVLWPLCCLPFDVRFWLPLWYLVAIVLYALRCTSSDYPFGVLWPLCCLPFDVRFWLPLWYLVAIVLSALRCTSSDYPFGVLWPLCCLPFDVGLLITPFGVFNFFLQHISLPYSSKIFSIFRYKLYKVIDELFRGNWFHLILSEPFSLVFLCVRILRFAMPDCTFTRSLQCHAYFVLP
jgi:hypothetical protein